MANEYFDHTGFPGTGTRASSALMRAELDKVEQGFDKLPTLTGNASEIVTVKSDVSGLESKTLAELHVSLDNGDTYTGVHDFTGGTVSFGVATAPTQIATDDSTKVATTAFVQDVSMNSALPTQGAGDAGKVLTSDGATADWELAIPSQSGNAGKVLTTNGTDESWGAVSLVRSARTSNTILAAADKGTLIDITSGTFSQTFTAAATLGSGWWCYIKNSGTGTVTLDPNASETIDGLATKTLPSGSVALVQCDGSNLNTAIIAPKELIREVILSNATNSLTAASVLENITPPTYSSGLGAQSATVIYGNSLFITNSSGGEGNVATSPDGQTWTLRAMPSSAVWKIATNGTTGFIATVATSTTTAKSTNGTTWVSGTVLPGASSASMPMPAYNGSTCLVVASAATTCYTTTDNGTTWSAAQTLPANVGSPVQVIGGLFWYWVSGTTAYTSATGATGSWTVRTLPVTPVSNLSVVQTNGKLEISSSTSTYETSDGINWTLAGSYPQGYYYVLINGVRVSYTATFGSCRTYSNSITTVRTSTYDTAAYAGMGTNGTVVCVVILSNALIATIPLATQTVTGLYTR